MTKTPCTTALIDTFMSNYIADWRVAQYKVEIIVWNSVVEYGGAVLFKGYLDSLYVQGKLSFYYEAHDGVD